MTGKSMPSSFTKVPFIYAEPANGRKFKMTILTGFAGMSVDKENFVRPQIGWSIHCHDSNKKKDQGKSKGKAKAPPIPSNPFDQIKNEDKDTIIEWAKKEKINITHLTNTKKMKFGTDASLRDESALRDAWYRHEEISGKKRVDR
jgi:hypothetical protein